MTQTNDSSAECTLIQSKFDALVQMVLGFIAMSVLILKRYIEYPRRSCQVWMFDASKQAIGALVAHFANMAIAITLHQVEDTASTSADECAFYFVNFTVDTTIGVVLNWALLSILTYVAITFRWESLRTPGDYGKPIEFSRWFIQLTTWLVIILLTKILLGLVIFVFQGPLGTLASWLFEPLKSHPQVELVIVMIACPCIMNALQFWVQDNFLKKKSSRDHVLSPPYAVKHKMTALECNDDEVKSLQSADSGEEDTETEDVRTPAGRRKSRQAEIEMVEIDLE